MLNIACISTIQASGGPVQVCDGSEEFPPYIYYERQQGKVIKDNIVGITVDLLKEISVLTGLEHEISLIPWDKCVYNSANFNRTQTFEVVTNAVFTYDRYKSFLYPAYIYQSTSGFLYSSNTFPEEITINKLSDLNQYELCGLPGYEYTKLYDAGMKMYINRDAKTRSGIISKLTYGRCDFMILSDINTIKGGETIGQYKLTKDLKTLVIDSIPTAPFYLLVSKQSPRANELSTKYSQAINELHRNGKITEITNRYLYGNTTSK